MVTSERTLLTVDEFEAFINLPENREGLFELINGEVVEKVVTHEHGLLVIFIGRKIGNYLEERDIGEIGTEISHRVPTDNLNERLPDLAIYLDTSRSAPKKGAVPYLPEMAIEVKSPNDTYKELREKARYYLANATKLVWLVIPEKRLIEFYTVDEEGVFTTDDTLTAPDLLPDFTLPVRAIFKD